MNNRLHRTIQQLLLASSTAVFAASALGVVPGQQNPPPGPNQVPDYFGIVPNYANSPEPVLAQVGSTTGLGTGAAASTYNYTNWAQTPDITDVQGGTGYVVGDVLTITGGGAGVSCDVTVNNVNAAGAIVPNVDATTGATSPGVTLPVGGCTGFTTPVAGTGLRKFVDSLPLLNTPNNLGQQLPIAVPDTTTFPGSDYYEIAVAEYSQQLHSDLPATHLRGYKQLNAPAGSAAATNHYLGPIIVAQKGRAVRIKLVNQLSTGAAGNLPVPVDTTYMGADTAVSTQNRTALHLHGGNTPWISDGTPRQTVKPVGEAAPNKGESVRYVPDMWFDAAGNLLANSATCTQGTTTCTTAGATNDPGDGSLTYYFTNQQSARLMFYHDHAEGITRLNVYTGIAAGYVLQDPTEQAMVNGGSVPQLDANGQPILDANGQPIIAATYTLGTLPSLADTIPLVIQEKTFVPNNSAHPVLNFYGPFASQLQSQDPTWRWGTTGLKPDGSGVISDGPNGNGDLWVPHVFMPNQNPGDVTGGNAMGRWDYGPWFWPPFTNISNGPIPNPYYDPACNTATSYCEPATIPGVPNGSSVGVVDAKTGVATSSPSGTPEAFNDTPLVNGTAYPYISVDPKIYRLRLLNAANDRMLNLSLVVAASKNTDSTANANAGTTGVATLCDGTNPVDPADCTEAKMVPFTSTQNSAAPFPAWWYTMQKGGVTFDGRPSGVFDPNTRGPAMVQIGTESGFLSSPAVIKNQPVNYQYNPRNILIGNIKEHALLLGPAERADVLVDFSNYAGSTLILYNDAPAPVPAWDLRVDYFTGDYDNTDTGGAFSTLPGYGPNTRTIMQIRVGTNGGTVAANAASSRDSTGTIDLAGLTTAVRTAFRTSQEPIIVPQAAYNPVYGTTVSDALGTDLSRIADYQLTFNPLLDTSVYPAILEPTAVTMDMGPKTIIEDWTMNWGRMNALLGTEVPRTTATIQTSIPQAYIDPPTELVKITPNTNATPISGTLADGTQLWKITHNGVDSHPIHFHLFHVQLVNRVGWDGAIYPPAANELGWKESVLMHPLSDVIVALRPMKMDLPFKVANSHRKLDPSQTAVPLDYFNLDPMTGNGSNVANANLDMNYGWEYVWHCHILGHEENDMMRSIAVAQPPEAPTGLTATAVANGVKLDWTDNSMTANWVEIQRSTDPGFAPNLTTTFNVKLDAECADQAGCARTYTDTTAAVGTSYFYKVVANNTVGGGDGRADRPLAAVAGGGWTYSETLPPEVKSLIPAIGGVNGYTGYANVTASSDASNRADLLLVPTATVTPGPLTFADQAVGTTSAAQTVTVSNSGNGNLSISGVALTTGTDYAITNGCPATLAPAASCNIDVTFTPTVVGAGLTDTLTITDNSSTGGPQTVALTGNGVATAPIAALSTTTLTFPDTTVGATSAVQTVTLSNTGSAPLNISSIIAPAQFAQTNNCPPSLAANANCAISVTFTPTAAGAAGGSLTITDDSSTGPTQSVNLSGTGVAAVNLVAVTNLTAQVNAANVMQLNWTDGSTLETGYRIQRCTGSVATTCAPAGTGWANVTTGIAAVPVGLTSPGTGPMTATLTANLPQNTVSYRVYPLANATVGPVSNAVSVNLGVNPAAPTNVVAPANATVASGVSLTWLDVANNNTEYRFRSRYATAFNANGTVKSWSTWVTATVTPAAGPSSQAITLTAAQIGASFRAGRTFQFQVGARNQAGTSYTTASPNVVVH